MRHSHSEDLNHSINQYFQMPMHYVNAQVKGPFIVQDRPRDLMEHSTESSLYDFSFTLKLNFKKKLTFKKLSLVEFWCSIKEYL